jgi:tetratricopeptide (TPR) repeat protein/predicted Ser/Thr protein kinase
MTYGSCTVGCPDAEVLAQLGADALTETARGSLLDHAASCAECHAAVAMLADAPPRSQPAVGTRIDRYELRRIVGAGAMGVVYAARDPELDRDVALKLLRPHASAPRLRREAQALARLAHPNVVRVYDVGEHAGQTFIAMELVDGDNLREWLRTPRGLDAIVAVLVQAGHGLAAAHRAGLVHRDFKPDNVLIANTGGVLVGDFGLARRSGPGSQDAAPIAPQPGLSAESLTATGAVVGTPAYMAPEQAAGEATPASDQYAFCVTAWEACFGQRPIAGTSERELRDNAAAGTLHKPADRAVPRRIEQALRRGLAVRPEARFAGMDGLLRALAPPSRRRWPWIAVAAAALTSTIAVLATGATEPPAVTCDGAGATIAPAWDPAVRTRIAERWGEAVADGFARYAASWQQHRVDACRATHERRDQTVSTLERQVACLDRARGALHVTIEALLDTPRDALPRPANAVESLPSLERCEGAAPAQATPPADRAPAIAALDAALARLDVSLLAGAPAVSSAATVALRRQAEQLGFRPQVVRAMLLEARVAAWSGDAASAEAVLRRTMILADQTADDFARTHAGALLARLLADVRLVEATGLAAAARAALDRAGPDPAIEQALLEADVAIATSRGDHREAVAIQERLVASIRARFGDDSPILMHAYTRLAVLWSAAGELAQTIEAQRRATDIVLRLGRDGPGEIEGLLSESIMALIAVGDYEGAVARGERQLAVMRGLPVHSLKIEAYSVAQVALAFELDGDHHAALEAYREAERLWSRPAAAFATTGEQPDAPAMAEGVAGAVFGQGSCLLSLGRADQAITELQRALALARAGGSSTSSLIEPTTRGLGQAFVAARRYRDARVVLEPIADRLATDRALKPYPRAMAMFALAQALWADGGLADRPRALALAADAERELGRAISDGEATLSLRKLPALARASLAQLAVWRAAHPAR